MAVKLTKRTTNDGVRYSLSGLTFAQLYRIKNAMFDCENKMKAIADDFVEAKNLAMARMFRDYASDAHEVAMAASEGCI